MHTHEKLHAHVIIHAQKHLHTNKKPPWAKMNIPVRLCSYQHQHSCSFQTFYPRREPRLQGNLLSSLTGFTSSVHRDGADLLCIFV